MAIKFEYPFKSKDCFRYVNSFEQFKNIKSDLLFSDVKNEKPIISVVIPTYKRDVVKYAILSVLEQKEAPDYELVIVDNNPDETELLEYIKGLKSNRIRYYRNEENIGMFGNWNRCIELANSENIVFCHSDDMLTEETLTKLWKLRQKVEPEAAILGRQGTIDINNNITGLYKEPSSKIGGILKPKNYFRLNHYSAIMGDYDNGCGEMLNKSVLFKIGGYDVNFYPASDGVLLMKYQAVAPIYRLNSQVRFCRIALNQCFEFAHLFPLCGYYMACAAIDRYFAGNVLLKYLTRLSAESVEIKEFNYKARRKLNFFEKILHRGYNALYTLTSNYKLL